MEDKELLIRLSVMLEAVVKKMDNIEIKVDNINDEKIRQLDKTAGITSEKVTRLEKIVYGAIALIFAQSIALVFLWIQRRN